MGASVILSGSFVGTSEGLGEGAGDSVGYSVGLTQLKTKNVSL